MKKSFDIVRTLPRNKRHVNFFSFVFLCFVSLLMLVSSSLAAECTADTISYWMINEGSGSTAEDNIGSNDGSITNAVWVAGKVNNSLDFDGDGDYVNAGSDSSLDNIFDGGGTIAV